MLIALMRSLKPLLRAVTARTNSNLSKTSYPTVSRRPPHARHSCFHECSKKPLHGMRSKIRCGRTLRIKMPTASHSCKATLSEQQRFSPSAWPKPHRSTIFGWCFHRTVIAFVQPLFAWHRSSPSTKAAKPRMTWHSDLGIRLSLLHRKLSRYQYCRATMTPTYEATSRTLKCRTTSPSKTRHWRRHMLQ